MSRRSTILRLLILAVALALTPAVIIVAARADAANDVPTTRIERLSEYRDGEWGRYRIDGVECIAFDMPRSFGASGGLSCDWTDVDQGGR